MLDAFESVDHNGDNWICFEEYCEVLEKAEPKISRRDMAFLYTEATRLTGTEQMSLKAFAKSCKKILHAGHKLPALYFPS